MQGTAHYKALCRLYNHFLMKRLFVVIWLRLGGMLAIRVDAVATMIAPKLTLIIIIMTKDQETQTDPTILFKAPGKGVSNSRK